METIAVTSRFRLSLLSTLHNLSNLVLINKQCFFIDPKKYMKND